MIEPILEALQFSFMRHALLAGIRRFEPMTC